MVPDMFNLASVLSVFAHPLAESAQPFASVIVDHQARQCLRDLLAKNIETLGGCEEVIPVLRGYRAQESAIGWSPTFARLKHQELPGSDATLHRSVVELGIMAHLSGIAGEWNFVLPNTTGVDIGRWRLSDVSTGRVAATNDRIIIDIGSQPDDSRIEFARDVSGGWSLLKTARNCHEIRTVSGGCGGLVQVPDRIEEAHALLPQGSTSRFCTFNEVETFSVILEEAFDLMTDYARPYMEWCVPAILRILPIVPIKATSSGSHHKFLGLVVMSNDARCAAIAEMLVHEASHQQFFLYSQLGAMTNGRDTQEYFSPLVGRSRPLERVILAYHALVNMGRFFLMCIENGSKDKYILGRLSVVRSQINDMRPSLEKTSGLSENGQNLFKAMDECVAAL